MEKKKIMSCIKSLYKDKNMEAYRFKDGKNIYMEWINYARKPEIGLMEQKLREIAKAHIGKRFVIERNIVMQSCKAKPIKE